MTSSRPTSDSPPARRTATILLRQPRQVRGFREPLADGLALTMIWIPPGRFWMGSPPPEPLRDDDEGPQHLVQLPGFFMGQTPITQAQWRVVAGWEPPAGERWERELKPEPSHFQAGGRPGPVEPGDGPQPGDSAGASRPAFTFAGLEGEETSDQRPVESVSWLDAMEFCRRLNSRLGAGAGRGYTLPSEAQWEYACRAGSTTPFAFGETLTAELANYNGSETYGNGPRGKWRRQTTPVGMGGKESVAKREREKGRGRRLLRGGSWPDLPGGCRSASRALDGPGDANDLVGFRVVCLPQGPSLDA